MLPNTIANFVNKLISDTQNNTIHWLYTSDNDMVSADYQGMKITLDYAFDYNMGIGIQRLSIMQSDGRSFFFPISEYDSGYTLLKQLYNEAQASDFKF